MKPRPLALSLLLAFTPAACAAPAWAQSSAEDPITSMARSRFKEGVEFYDKFQYEQARAAFLQAYALKKHPAVLLNLAWSCLKSGHALEAERYFKQFLAEGKDITDKQRSDANEGVTQAHSKIGRIEVSAPAGTEVTIDGDRVGSAPLPEPVAVEPGAHTLTFKGPDSATETQSVTVLGGEKAVARFTKGGAAAVGAGAPPGTPSSPPAGTPPTASTSATPPPEEAPGAGEHPPAKETPHHEAAKKGPLAPPANMVPVIVGIILTGAGIGVAIAMNNSKQSAQTQANSTAQNVVAHMDTCPASPNSTVPGLVAVCNQYQADINDVNSDATIGNLAIGFAAAALAGTLIYWLASDKGDEDSASGATTKPVVVPMFGRAAGGLSISGGF